MSEDEQLLLDALALEQLAIATYAACSQAAQALVETAGRGGAGATLGSVPTPRTLRVLRRFREQEREHAELLVSLLDALGVRAPEPPAGAAALARARSAAGLVRPLDRLRTQPELVAVAIELENAQIARYLDAIGRLRDVRLTSVALQVMGAEAQHSMVLRGLLSENPVLTVPEAFERGEADYP